MASRSTLSSNPDVLIEYMDNMPYESESDDDFDGYLEPDEGPVAYRRSQEIEELSTPVRRTQSVNDLTSTFSLSRRFLAAPPSLTLQCSRVHHLLQSPAPPTLVQWTTARYLVLPVAHR